MNMPRQKPRDQRRASQKPEWQKDIVKERIRILFDKAGESFKAHPENSNRYVEMALKLSMRYNIRLGPELKRRFCKSCKAYLVPGANARVRTNPSQKAVIVTCSECGSVARYPYRREARKSR